MRKQQKGNYQMTNFTVGILGLGNIGMGLDYYKPDNVFWTHAKSFYHHSNFTIEYLIDKDDKKLQLAQQKYKTVPFLINDIDEIDHFPDIMVLASSPQVNRAVFNEIKDKKEIRFFILEKPFWDDCLSFGEYEKYSNKCIINYFRRFTPFYRNLRRDILNNQYGNTLGVHIYYCKGLRNSASHFIDLVDFIYSGKYNIGSVNPYHITADYVKEDSSVGFTIKYINEFDESFPIVFQTGNVKKYFFIELDFIFERGRLRISNFESISEKFKVIKDLNFDSYKNLTISDTQKIEINNYGYDMCNYVYSLLTNPSEENVSSLYNEVVNFKLIKRIIENSITI